jgi:hypothetical protein
MLQKHQLEAIAQSYSHTATNHEPHHYCLPTVPLDASM